MTPEVTMQSKLRIAPLALCVAACFAASPLMAVEPLAVIAK